MQASQDCGTSEKSLLTETLSCGMRGEPGTHIKTYSQSSYVAPQVNIDSSFGSEYSTPSLSPDDQQCQSFTSGQPRQQTRLCIVEDDIDAGLTCVHVVNGS